MRTLANEPGLILGELSDLSRELKEITRVLNVFNDALNLADVVDMDDDHIDEVVKTYVNPDLAANLHNAAVPVVRLLGEVQRKGDQRARKLANMLAETSWAKAYKEEG